MRGHQRDFKGVWIPKHLWTDQELSPIEMILLVEIDSLDKGDGCSASNEYLSAFLRGRATPGSVANIITDLRKRGYVVNRGFDGRNRYISLHENVKAGFMKTLRQPSSSDEGCSHEIMNADFMKTLRQPSQNHDYINESNINTKTPLLSPLNGKDNDEPADTPSADETYEERKQRALAYFGQLQGMQKQNFLSGALSLKNFGEPEPARNSEREQELITRWFEVNK